MRLLIFLLAFVLSNQLSAQCHIFDMNAEVVDCSNGQFYVVINFEHQSVGAAGFKVVGNGVVYGTYQYSDLPVTIGPLPANATNYEFVAKDVNHPDCSDFDEVGQVNCGPACEVYDMVVETGPCTNIGGYLLDLDFQVQNATNDSFDLWVNTNTFFGTFHIDSLPLRIPNFPSDGGDYDRIKVCVDDNPHCCRVKEFLRPACPPPPSACEITSVKVETGDCNPDGTYHAWVNFEVNHPGNDFYEVWANGHYLGHFPIAQKPLHIEHFPTDGGPNDVIKVCINDHPDCCKKIEFPVPACIGGGCVIKDLVVKTGDCNSDGTYQAVVNFAAHNTGTIKNYTIWANGKSLGSFPLAGLPLKIEHFPTDGGPNDFIKICINDHPDCCAKLEFPVPPCLGTGCTIKDLKVETGDCNPDGTYVLWLKFTPPPSPSVTSSFKVWTGNGVLVGTYPIGSLPLKIANFPTDGGPNDVIKVCMADMPNCCGVIEFPVPACVGSGCSITNLKIETGDCNNDGTYNAWINFVAKNTGTIKNFTVWANGKSLGSFPLSGLPLKIEHFPTDGGPNDFIKICINDHPDCCAKLEFPVPPCLGSGCTIKDLKVETGDCNPDGTYALSLKFTPPPSPSVTSSFKVWTGNGVLVGTYPIGSLPLKIANFPTDGGPNDVIKVCMADMPNCCGVIEFPVPACVGSGCSITNLKVETGPCNNDGTYIAWINFVAKNTGTIKNFTVWANGKSLGSFPLSGLPLKIEHFPTDGGPNDFIAVCINDHPDCCAKIQFPVPACLGNSGCTISNLKVETGDCNPDGTYVLWVNFTPPPSPTTIGFFKIFTANGKVLGPFPTTSLPLKIEHFPTDGGPNDYIKVCMADIPNCCAEKEFPVPPCVNQPQCKIYDLHGKPTPCLCGQFFAVVQFFHQNGGSGGFDVFVNGQLYDNFPYNTPQPLILGPFDGDSLTNYKIIVRDHNHPDCADDLGFGVVKCPNKWISNFNPTVYERLNVTPNPAIERVQVSAYGRSGQWIFQSKVDVYQAQGKRVRSFVVPDGSSFSMDVSDLPQGIYRVQMSSDLGIFEGTFVKL